MRIALVIPEDTPPTGGNTISARRVQAGLEELGHQADTVLYRPGLSGYDVYHAWNAIRVGGRLVEEGVDPHEIVATWTGTDLWQDWASDPTGQRRRLDPIRFQVTFTEDGRARLLEDAPDWAERVLVIPPSVDIGHFEPTGPVQEVPHPFILLAGGIRPVKRTAWAIDLVDRLRDQSGRDYQLGIAGPVRQAQEWQQVQSKAQEHSWVHLLGDRSRQEMPSWYRAADIFLNTSEVEGVSNALMEAMACATLVLATDIRGNRSLIDPGQTGLLFATPEEFIDQVAWITQNPEAVRTIRQNGRHKIVARHSTQFEAEQYVRLYEECAAVRGCRR